MNVNGNDVPMPLASNGALTVWRWTWTWDGRGIPTDISSWDWNWDGSDPSLSGEGTVTSEQAPAGLTAGTWIWNWQWSRPDGQAWDWAPPGLSVDCACVWIWDWSWNWAVEPAAASTPTSDDAAPVDGGAAVTQSNLVTAGAYATAEATIDGSVDQAPSGLVSVDQAAPSGLASLGLVSVFAGQIVTVDQEVSATARAVQSGVSNVAYGWKRVAQANTVEGVAVADAAATAVQGVAQGHEREVGPSRGEGGVDQWAGQQIEVSQTATADADASQSHIVGKSPVSRSAVVVRAAASAVVVVQQEIEQESVVGRGDHDLWAGQLFQAAQIADASAAGAQSDDEIDPGVVRPSSRVARSTAAALAAAYSLQSARQLAAGAGDTSQIAQQLVQVLQGSAAHAATIQPPRSPVGGDGESLATTDADASGRAFMEELSTQASIEGGEQETTQNISVLQLADATSSAIGGVSGGGRVVNCATVGQSSQQAIGLDAFGVALTDATTFCTPAADDPGTTEAAAPAAEPLAANTVAFTVTGPTRCCVRSSRQVRVPRLAAHLSSEVLPGAKAAFLAPTAPFSGAASASPISTRNERGAAERSPLRKRVGQANGSSPLPSEPGSVDGAGSSASAPGAGGGGGLAVLASRRFTTPKGYLVAWADPTVRRSEHYSGRLETPG